VAVKRVTFFRNKWVNWFPLGLLPPLILEQQKFLQAAERLLLFDAFPVTQQTVLKHRSQPGKITHMPYPLFTH